MLDVRQISVVRDNPDVFSSQIPVYYRVDMLKVIVLIYSIENEGCDAAIFSDLEVGEQRPKKDRMDKSELFSVPITKKLKMCVLEAPKDVNLSERSAQESSHPVPKWPKTTLESLEHKGTSHGTGGERKIGDWGRRTDRKMESKQCQNQERQRKQIHCAYLL
jgi:hypothetical protein